jgi:imidazole glycerol phosphate synthase subunit hisH (EC 2.4.2.-)
MRVGVVDYTVGNIGSVLNALRRAGAEPQIIKKPEEARDVDVLLLPGVGTYAAAYEMIHVFKESVLEKPTLAICLGMQLLFEESQEAAAEASPYSKALWRGYRRRRRHI